MTVELSPDDATDPGLSPLRNFGNEVMLERVRMNMSRVELGRAVACGESLVAKIERGDRVPQREFAEGCDRVIPYANGRFVRLWRLVIRYAYPPWFRPYVALEEKATMVRMFNPQLIPGLVQTPDYARAILRTGRPDNLDELLTARLERQRILVREDNPPANLRLVLNEAVLRNVVGDPAIMRGQLAHLRDLGEVPRNRVQIIPDRGRHHGYQCPFGLLSFSEGADVAHVDGFPRGYVLAEPDDVSAAQEAYDLLTAMAASPDESAELIGVILKGCYP